MSSTDITGLIGLLDSGKTAEALELATQLVREMPMLATGHVVRARALESNGEFGEAILAWRHALDLVPNSPIIVKGFRRTVEKSVEKNVAPPQADTPGDTQTADPMDDAFDDPSAATADLPGFGSSDSMFDVEPEFEQRVADDLRRETGDPNDANDANDDDLTTDTPHESVADELDALIAGLTGARIRPSDTPAPAPDLESRIEDMASETLARIYADQQQFEEAARVYERLAETRPADRERYLERAALMLERAGRS